MINPSINLPANKYSHKFIKLLAMALQMNLVDNSEIQYWLGEGWGEDKMNEELWRKVRKNEK